MPRILLVFILFLALLWIGFRVLRHGQTQLTVTSSPSELEVFIDGTKITTPQTVNLPAGSYTLRAYRDGYLPYQSSVQIADGRRAKTKITLIPDTEYVPSEGAPAP